MSNDAETRNSKALASFTEYCNANPKQRFWQALTNWSGHDYILTVNAPYIQDVWNAFVMKNGSPAIDPYHAEGEARHNEYTPAERDRLNVNATFEANLVKMLAADKVAANTPVENTEADAAQNQRERLYEAPAHRKFEADE